MTPKPQALTVVSPRGMRRVLLATTALVAMAALPANAQDLPTNGQVVAGTATIQTAGQDMTVTTATQRTVIDWKSFSVTADHRLSFNLSIGVQKGPPIGVQKGPPSSSCVTGMAGVPFALVAA